MSKKIVSVHEGLTYEYLVHGLFVLIAGGILFALNIFLGGIVVLAGFLLMVVSTGIDVDIDNEKIRKYKSILVYKFGLWIDLKQYTQAELKYNPNSVKTPNYMPTIGAQPVVLPNPGAAAKTFDLFLVNDLNEKRLLNQFLKISLALKTLKALEQIKRLTVINHFENDLFEKRKDRSR